MFIDGADLSLMHLMYDF